MGLADTAKLVVDLSLKGNYVSGVNKAIKATDRLDRSATRGYRAGQQIGIGIKNLGRIAVVGIGLLASQVALGVRSLVKLEQAQKQTEAVIKSTGGVARVTAGGVRRLAEEFESLNAIIGDEIIQSAENMLLTFTNIRGKAFKPTLAAVLDLNTALGRGPEGLTNTALLVGKALQDPEKGLTALRRAGVTFDKSQIKRIKSLIKEGKLYDAQKIVLAELAQEFGGSFKKQGESSAAVFAKLGDAVEDAQRALAKGMLPVVRKVADALAKLVADPAFVRGVEDFGKGLAGLFTDQNIQSGIQTLKDGFKAAQDAAPAIIAGARLAGSIVSTAVNLFKSLPPEIQKLAIGAAAVNKLTGGLITNIGGGIFDRLFARGSSPVNPMWVAMAGGGLPGAPLGGGKPGAPGSPSGAITPAIGAGIAVDTNWLWQFYHDELDRIHDRIAVPGKPSQINPDRIDDAIQHRINAAAAGLLAQRHGEQGGGAGAPHHVTPQLKGQGVITAPIHDLAGAVKALNIKIAASPDRQDPRGLHAGFATLSTSIANLGTGFDQIEDRRVSTPLIALDASVQRKGEQTVSGLSLVQQQTASSAGIIVSSQNAAAANIVGAIWAARPVVNVTNVTKSTTIQNRYGPGNGSYGQNPGGH